MEAQTVHRPRLIYTLYIIGAFIWPLMFVGVFLAYVERAKVGEPIILSHLYKQIGIFWNFLVCAFVGGVVLGVYWCVVAMRPTGAGFIFLALWVVFRFTVALVVLVLSIPGLNRLDGGEAAFSNIRKDTASLWS